MSETMKAPDHADDLSALPASEFGPHAGRMSFDDSMISAPIMTVGKVKVRIAGLILDIEALRLVNGTTGWPTGAMESAHQALSYIDLHAAAVERRDTKTVAAPAEIVYLR